MTAIFCQPTKITYQTASTLTAAEPKNLANDEPGLVWRSASTSGAYFVFQTDNSSFDTIALIGNNLRATDTFRVRMGADVASLNGVPAFDQTYAAWTGIAPLENATSVVLLSSPVTYPYIRIDFTSTGNPDGYIEVCRLLLGKRITNVGIDLGHEETFDDRSSITDGKGFTLIDRYNVRQTHKISISQINEEQYYNDWQPFLASVGQSKFFLYMEEDSGPYIQRKIAYVRNTAQPKRTRPAYDLQDIELTVTTYR